MALPRPADRTDAGRRTPRPRSPRGPLPRTSASTTPQRAAGSSRSPRRSRWADTRLTAEDADAPFARIDKNHDGYLSVDELLDAVRDYYTGTDEDAPGNLLFGEL
ncbi:hypothetical protein ACFWUW_18875 [Streptomyces sp. NPDC058655]|uniref:hypothetical protein n=1 Tax=Streptomyces sp. NPDC058655 TaxID=3346577 RepID=UPI0036502215